MANKYKTISNIIITALILGLSLFSIYQYVEYKINNISKEIKENNIKNEEEKEELNKKVAVLEEIVKGTEANITDALEKEREKNNSMINQFDEISNTVGALSKLSKTDPELLKKYSKVYFLNEHYVPISLSDIDSTYVSNKNKKYQIHSDVLEKLESMIKAGNDEGVSLLVLSAYRSFQTQTILKDNYKMIYGAGANKFSADQGYSEHQLGTTVDFTTQKTNGKLEGFDKTPEYKWMKENAYKYGFIISYPSGNAYYKYEPWHWRYVGVALATKLHEDGKYFYDVDQRIIDNYLINIFD